ncbi:MAG: hypothetical protein U0359_29565 [Byssovorax sp.]
MPGPIESSGDIQVFCHTDAISASRGNAFFGALTPGDTVYLVFNPDDGTSPPYRLKITSPTGAVLLDQTVRDLPTREPQSPPPISFVLSTTGSYKIEIKEAGGRQSGVATLRAG